VSQWRDVRFSSRQPVSLTILDGQSNDGDSRIAAFMENISGRGLSLVTGSKVPLGSAVRVDVNDNLLLGEVCHSAQTGPSEFVCGVRLEQALTSVNDLSRLVAVVMGESQRDSDNRVDRAADRRPRQIPS
jgi:hypothetical protein